MIVNPVPYPSGRRILRCAACYALLVGATTASVASAAHYPAVPGAAAFAAGQSIRIASAGARRLAQDDEGSADSDIAPDQVEKYIAVYRDMQRDRGLPVEQAAAKENLTMSAFRELERKIERDEPTREHVRAELQAAAATPSAPK